MLILIDKDQNFPDRNQVKNDKRS